MSLISHLKASSKLPTTPLLLGCFIVATMIDGILLHNGMILGVLFALSLVFCIPHCWLVIKYSPLMPSSSLLKHSVGVVLYLLLAVMPLLFWELVLIKFAYTAADVADKIASPMDPMALVLGGIFVTAPLAIGGAWHLVVETVRAGNMYDESGHRRSAQIVVPEKKSH